MLFQDNKLSLKLSLEYPEEGWHGQQRRKKEATKTGGLMMAPNSWRQFWRVAGRESGSPELLESPRTSQNFPGDFPGTSLTSGFRNKGLANGVSSFFFFLENETEKTEGNGPKGSPQKRYP